MKIIHFIIKTIFENSISRSAGNPEIKKHIITLGLHVEIDTIFHSLVLIIISSFTVLLDPIKTNSRKFITIDEIERN